LLAHSIIYAPAEKELDEELYSELEDDELEELELELDDDDGKCGFPENLIAIGIVTESPIGTAKASDRT